MGVREKLVARVQPLLPGETVQVAFPAQSGMTPYLGNIFGLIGQAAVRRRIIAVTDRSITVFDADFNGTRPRTVVRRLPRDTKLGPAKGVWALINAGGDEKTWTHAKFRKDVAAADAALPATTR